MRIKEVLKENGLTAAAVAQRMGVVPEALSRIINGGNPTVKKVEQIAAAIGVPVAELFEAPAATPVGSAAKCPHCGGALHIEVGAGRDR